VQFQLLILESIGTQELILVGLVALIVFGPRKLPQMARKFGKMMTELRKVSNDFRATWEREATMVESAFKMDEEEARVPRTIGSPADDANAAPAQGTADTDEKGLPSVTELSPADFGKFAGSAHSADSGVLENSDEGSPASEKEAPAVGKTDWL
jgi:Tat protein translocase TatB subunit